MQFLFEQLGIPGNKAIVDRFVTRPGAPQAAAGQPEGIAPTERVQPRGGARRDQRG